MEDTALVDQISAFLNDYPYLWMLYGFILFVPVVLFVTIFCWPKRVDPVAQRKKTDAPTPDDVEDKPSDRLVSYGGGTGETGGEKDRSRGAVEARNATFEKSSELKPSSQVTPPTINDDESESHDQILDTRTLEDLPVIATNGPHMEDPEFEIPQEETPLITDSPQEETPVITDSPQEETPVITDSPQEETPVITDSPQEETPVITDSPQEETPVITDSPQEETPVITDTQKEEPPIITDSPQEETSEIMYSQEDEIKSPNGEVSVINGHQEEAPTINQEHTVNEDVPAINDANEAMHEHQNGTSEQNNVEMISGTKEEAPVIKDTTVEDTVIETENGDTPAILADESKQTIEQSDHLEKSEDEIKVANGDDHDVESGYQEPQVLTNGLESHHDKDDAPAYENGVLLPTEEEAEEETAGRWRFPPVLEDFDLMETEADPDELESMFHDDRLAEIYLDIKEDGPGLGISIVGGNGSPSGDLPIIVKRVLPDSLAERDGRLKAGDELVAINEKLLVGVSKDYAINVLSNNDGLVRLLVLQDY